MVFGEANRTPRPRAPRGNRPPSGHDVSAWSPLRHRTYRMLWVTWVIASLCMWMSEVAAAWLMTSLSDAPVMVALVQTAATLPVFLLGLPSGALADIVDRRRMLIATQVWAAIVALLLAVLALADLLTPGVLLVLVFANGIVLAARWPVHSALVPSLVPRAELQEAMALNGVANNGSRLAGPLIAGAVIAASGVEHVFAINAALAFAAILMLARWKHERKASTLPSERFFAAIRVGLQHVRQSADIRRVMARAAAFFLGAIALIALLPLVARGMQGGGPGTFTLLLAAMGAGAVAGAFLLPLFTRRMSHDRRVASGTLLFCAAAATVAVAPNVWIAMPGMLVAGIAYMFASNPLMVAAQHVLPDWVRARGLSVYQMGIMGASALGAALWGQVASLTGVSASLLIASGIGAVSIVFLRRLPLPAGGDDDLSPSTSWKMPPLAAPIDADEGPVLVTIEYRIDPGRVDEFLAVMRESRRVWLSSGLLAWSLFSDVSERGRYLEHMVDESWAAYIRRNERVAASYVRLRERKHAFHTAAQAPTVTRYVAESVAL
jgi:MFS family permease